MSETQAAVRTSEARERILATADRLFYDEGIHAVGIQRIVAESSVTRVTLYRHFGSKDDLIASYLGRRAKYDHDQVDGIIERNADDPRAALTELATALTRDDFGAVRRGCPFINASAEFTGSHPSRVHAREIRSWVTGRLEDLLRLIGHRDPQGRGAAADDGADRCRRLRRAGRQRPAQRRLPRVLGGRDRRRPEGAGLKVAVT